MTLVYEVLFFSHFDIRFMVTDGGKLETDLQIFRQSHYHPVLQGQI